MSHSDKITPSDKVKISQIGIGFWRLLEWKMSDIELLKYIQELLELGISTFDHADIYGNYECEKAFGKMLSKNKQLRASMQLITKCGIKLKSDKFPDRKIKIYDTSKNHIIESVHASLKNLSTDYIDLLLIHRPDPFMAHDEVAEAFYRLENDGVVLNFGVSNFSPMQFETLQTYFNGKLVTNQIEISPYHLEHFNNGNIDYCMKENIMPMAWSPLGGGKLMHPTDEKSARIHAVLKTIAAELGIEHIGQLILAWLMAHPSGILPILGSGNIAHVKSLADSNFIRLSREDWYRIYIASGDSELP